MSSLMGDMGGKIAGFVSSYVPEDIDTKNIGEMVKATKAAEVTQDAEAFSKTQTDPGNASFVAAAKTKSLPKDLKVRKTEKTTSTDKKKAVPADEVNKRAREFDQTHPELGSEALKQLHAEIEKDENPTVESLLAKITAAFPKKSQASDALGFLLLTTKGPLREIILEAKKQFDADPKNSKEIEEGHFVTGIARGVAKDAESSAKAEVNYLAKMIAEDSEAIEIFDKIARDYPSEKEFNKYTESLLKHVGSSLDKVEELSPALIASCSFIQKVQTLRGVIKEFNNGMSVMEIMLKQEDFTLPPEINGYKMAKVFLELALSRNPSSNKLREAADRMTIPSPSSSAPAA